MGLVSVNNGGYNIGYEAGYDKGYEDGYAAGYAQGYADGLAAGKSAVNRIRCQFSTGYQNISLSVDLVFDGTDETVKGTGAYGSFNKLRGWQFARQIDGKNVNYSSNSDAKAYDLIRITQVEENGTIYYRQ